MQKLRVLRHTRQMSRSSRDTLDKAADAERRRILDAAHLRALQIEREEMEKLAKLGAELDKRRKPEKRGAAGEADRHGCDAMDVDAGAPFVPPSDKPKRRRDGDDE